MVNLAGRAVVQGGVHDTGCVAAVSLDVGSQAGGEGAILKGSALKSSATPSILFGPSPPLFADQKKLKSSATP